MTVEQKREALSRFCAGRICSACVLMDEKVCRCRNRATFEGHKVGDSGYMSDAEIIGAYEIVFGKNEIETAELKEAVAIPDTVHVDNVKNLYFTINNFNNKED